MTPPRHGMRTTAPIFQQTLTSAISSRSIQHRTVPTRLFSSTPTPHSHIGSAPLSIPASVTMTVIPPVVNKRAEHRVMRVPPMPSVVVKGPLGQLTLKIPAYIKIEHDDATRKAVLDIFDRSDKTQRAMWGTTRAYLANYIFGVSEGHTTLLRLVGVGYRASVEPAATTVQPEFPGQKFVSLKVGYSHPIELPIPRGVTASTPQPTRILLEGVDKEAITKFAAAIRKWRVPEPYKGKGIFVGDETIQLKSKKVK